MKYIPPRSLLIVLILIGCAGKAPFREFNALSPIAALDEIASRRRSLNNIESSMTIGLESPIGKIHLRCMLIVENGSYWRLNLSGPLGVDLATVEIKSDRFVMKSVQQGEILEGTIDDPLFIPNMGITLPPLRYLVPMLIPYPNIIFPQEWNVTESKMGANGILSLDHTGQSGIEYINLHLDYNPLRIYDEISDFKDSTSLHRSYKYDDNKSYLPTAIVVKFRELTLNITYNSLSIHKKTTSPNQYSPL